MHPTNLLADEQALFRARVVGQDTQFAVVEVLEKQHFCAASLVRAKSLDLTHSQRGLGMHQGSSTRHKYRPENSTFYSRPRPNEIFDVPAQPR